MRDLKNKRNLQDCQCQQLRQQKPFKSQSLSRCETDEYTVEASYQTKCSHENHATKENLLKTVCVCVCVCVCVDEKI